MHHASNLAESALPIDTQAQAPAPTTTLDPSSRGKPSPSVLDAFWRRMLAMYGHTWASQYGDHASGVTAETWSAALAGITGPQIADGLRACVAEGREFPPSAPRFRGMCLGIPSFAQVKLESTRADADRCPFTRAAWQFIDGYGYRHASAKDADRMLRDAYELAVEQRMRGAELPTPSEAIEHHKPEAAVIPETREARLARMRAVLGADFNPAVEDPDFDPVKTAATAERLQAEAALQKLRESQSARALHQDDGV